VRLGQGVEGGRRAAHGARHRLPDEKLSMDGGAKHPRREVPRRGDGRSLYISGEPGAVGGSLREDARLSNDVCLGEAASLALRLDSVGEILHEVQGIAGVLT
jgi:hypothetical protein